jgi:hypothetical protein
MIVMTGSDKGSVRILALVLRAGHHPIAVGNRQRVMKIKLASGWIFFLIAASRFSFGFI